MKTFNSPGGAAKWCEEQRGYGLSIGLVPTMGALHAGHLQLVKTAAAQNDMCIASIFVNPLQFNARDDFSAYPRDMQHDHELLQQAGCAMVFSGELSDFFPGSQGMDDIELLDPGPFAEGLEGEHRPGHFAGVRTIVDRLFEFTHPHRAYFGEKDFQQLLVVRDLARQKGFPEIVPMPTIREASGLAMSSRNQRLSASEREQATVIYRALLAAKEAWQAGERHADNLARTMLNMLEGSGLEVEYAAVRDPLDWQPVPARQPMQRARGLIAARLGPVRLIDNLQLHED